MHADHRFFRTTKYMINDDNQEIKRIIGGIKSKEASDSKSIELEETNLKSRELESERGIERGVTLRSLEVQMGLRENVWILKEGVSVI